MAPNATTTDSKDDSLLRDLKYRNRSYRDGDYRRQLREELRRLEQKVLIWSEAQPVHESYFSGLLDMYRKQVSVVQVQLDWALVERQKQVQQQQQQESQATQRLPELHVTQQHLQRRQLQESQDWNRLVRQLTKQFRQFQLHYQRRQEELEQQPHGQEERQEALLKLQQRLKLHQNQQFVQQEQLKQKQNPQQCQVMTKVSNKQQPRQSSGHRLQQPQKRQSSKLKQL
jgi:hypothetical protein